MALSLSLYESLFDGDPDGLVVVDPSSGRVRDCNRRYSDLVGREKGEIVGTRLTAVSPDDSTQDQDVVSMLIAQSTDTMTGEIRSSSGAIIPVKIRSSTVTVDDERLLLARVVECSNRSCGRSDDIRDQPVADLPPSDQASERTRYQQEFELAHRLLETVQSGVFRTEASSDGTVEYANPALASLLGADSPEQLQEYRVSEFYADPPARIELVEALRGSDQRQVKREVTLKRLDGEQIDVVITASLTEDETGTEYLHTVVQDVTGRKIHERQLERYERLIENLPLGVYQNTPGPDGAFTFLNQGMVDLFDADSKQQLRNTPVRDLYVNPDDRQGFSDQLRTEGIVTDREVELQTLQGDHLWGAVTAIARTVDGETVFDGVIRDITEQKQYDQRLREQRDDLTVLNQMLRHDIRNDLQVITAYTNLLEEMVDDEGREHLETITSSTDHAVELTRTARDLSEIMLSTDEIHDSVAFRSALNEEIDDIRSEYSDAVITVEGSLPDVSVVADEMLNSVFRNLLKNAIQHNDSAVPTVRVSAQARADTVTVQIADNGSGIPDERKRAVFGKGEKGLESEGTGMGLYLVKTLTENYGGDVWIEDNDPEGAVLVVELPRAT